MFEYAVLHVLKSVVVVIEFLFHLREIEAIACKHIPRQIENLVEIGVLHRVVGRLRVQSLKFGKFLLELLLHLLAPLHLFGATFKFIDVAEFVYAQFVLNGANLLLQEMVALLLREFFASARLYGSLKVEQLAFFCQLFIKQVSASLNRVFCQEFHLHVGLERRVASQEID